MENRYGSGQPGYDTDTFGTTGQTYQGRKEGTYQQDTSWRTGPDAYRQNTTSQGTYGSNRGTYQAGTQPGIGFGIASLVLGILSLVFFWTFLNIPMAILAVIFAIIHLCRQTGHKGMAVAGIVTSVISVILTVVMIVLGVLFLAGTDFWGYSYSQTLPFEQFSDGDGAPGSDEWEYDPDEPGEFLSVPGQEQTF